MLWLDSHHNTVCMCGGVHGWYYNTVCMCGGVGECMAGTIITQCVCVGSGGVADTSHNTYLYQGWVFSPLQS